MRHGQKPRRGTRFTVRRNSRRNGGVHRCRSKSRLNERTLATNHGTRLRERLSSGTDPAATVLSATHPVFFGCGGIDSARWAALGFGFFYYKYAMMIEDKFGGGAIRTNSSVYAMPRQVVVGDTSDRKRIDRASSARRLHRRSINKVGYYRRSPEGVAITTGPAVVFPAPHRDRPNCRRSRREESFHRPKIGRQITTGWSRR